MFLSSMMFHCGASVCRGSLVFRASDFLARDFLVFMDLVVLLPGAKWIPDGYILRGGFLSLGDFASLMLSESPLSMTSGW